MNSQIEGIGTLEKPIGTLKILVHLHNNEKATITNLIKDVRLNQRTTYSALEQLSTQVGEIVYLNAEGGLQVNSSPDNWGGTYTTTDWTNRHTATICDSSGYSTLPGNVSIVSSAQTTSRMMAGSYIGSAALNVGGTGDGLRFDSILRVTSFG